MTADLESETVAKPIAALNDAFRRAGPNGDWYVTSSVHAKGLLIVAKAFRAVQAYAAFDADNDPYGEHDFGGFTVDGVKLWFKIDAYDRELQWGSPDPTDASVTRRVLTIMLPEEY